MEIIYKRVADLIPYANNPRKNDKSAEQVAASIREFGFKVPLVIDRNGVVVTGHTRLKAAKKLKMQEVPCIIADDLSDEQVKAFRLADNKVSEASEWDFEKLDLEIKDLDFDLGQFGFEIPDLDEKDPDDGYYGDARERTFNAVNLLDVDLERTAGKYQLPTLSAENHVPKDLISFNYVLNTDEFEKGVHFYIDDYQFERVWNDPHGYVQRLSEFDCVLTPDFSLYTEMPLAMRCGTCIGPV